MGFTFLSVSLAVGLLLGMLVCLEFGRRFGRFRLAADPENAMRGTGPVEGAVFGLYALLVAFTFSGAAGRFDDRLRLAIQEEVAVGTAYLRIDLLPAALQPPLRDRFRQYLGERIEIYRQYTDKDALARLTARTDALQSEIWSLAVAACTASGSNSTTGRDMVISSLNEMFDIANRRMHTRLLHPPKVIFVLLFVLGLVCSFMAGHGMAENKRPNWVHMLAFAIFTSLTVYVILDIEYPRHGLIRVDSIDQILVELLQRMK